MLNANLPVAPADALILPMSHDLAPAIQLATQLARFWHPHPAATAEDKKFKAKMGYADKLGIPYVLFLGEDEIAAGVVSCKDMATGEQIQLSADALVQHILAGLAEKNRGPIILPD